MSQPTISVSDTPHNLRTNTPSVRNKNRNRRPCGNCSGSKVRCNVSQPYTKHLCKRCREDGLTECPPYVQRNVRKRRAPYRKGRRNLESPNERTDASYMVFINECVSSSNKTEVSQVGRGGSSEIATMSGSNAGPSSQTAIVPAARELQYSVACGQTVQSRDQVNDIGTSSGNIATTSTSTANNFDGLNTNSILNNGTALEHQLFSSRWFDFVNGRVDGKPSMGP
ncbi:hypothetical protein BD410DRAFT_795058 [Rickenella mellea]|uniref:Zn(2)-C6 fungal-type domain-containing protein n=1 Tax=Rickenella mellea TaxID=50990 RepID=A0A4Y7PNZ9_9AGAM|nr:hypothetical protein BD410DRAFT_795058 [Rickenella mellea]